MVDEIEIGILFFLLIVGVYIALLAAVIGSLLVAGVSAGGVLLGGGTAITNYGKSFKENMIDSNRASFA